MRSMMARAFFKSCESSRLGGSKRSAVLKS